MAHGVRIGSLVRALSLGAVLCASGCGAQIGGGGTAGGPADGGTSIDAARPDAAQPDAALPCTAGDKQVESQAGACYMYFSTAVTRDQAEAACEGLGAHLAVVTSQGENLLLSSIAPTSGANNAAAWIGGDYDTTGGVWTWLDAEPWGYTHWRQGEPNGTTTAQPENCNVLEGLTSGVPCPTTGDGCEWDDHQCGNVYPYLCERP